MISQTEDPYLNLALEEILLKNFQDDIFLLWQSMPSLIVGKHQNALAEINCPYVFTHNIPVARRLSGGGTVYHDGGNLNYSFFRQGETGKLIDFNRFIYPILEFLRSLGVEAEAGQQHDIRIGGLKISGNAEHVYKNRVLHHGTLLFSSDLNRLRESLRIAEGKYTHKGVRSNPSRVINLQDCLSQKVSLDEFRARLIEFVREQFQGRTGIPREKDLREASILAENKYRTREWIYGWSPDYEFNNTFQIERHEVQVRLAVHRGLIRECSLVAKGAEAKKIHLLQNALIGCLHEPEEIKKVLGIWNPDLTNESGLLYGLF